MQKDLFDKLTEYEIMGQSRAQRGGASQSNKKVSLDNSFSHGSRKNVQAAPNQQTSARKLVRRGLNHSFHIEDGRAVVSEDTAELTVASAKTTKEVKRMPLTSSALAGSTDPFLTSFYNTRKEASTTDNSDIVMNISSDEYQE